MVVDIPIKCCVRLLHLVPILLYLTFRDGKPKVQHYTIPEYKTAFLKMKPRIRNM